MLRIFAFTQTLPFQNRQCRKLAYKINKKIADYGKKRLYLFSIKHFLHSTFCKLQRKLPIMQNRLCK